MRFSPSTGLRAFAGTAAALAATLTFSLPASAQGSPAGGLPVVVATTLKIGVIGSFTGRSADFGMPMANGILQAVDEINAVGGYFGRKIEVVRKDDQPIRTLV